MNRVLFYALIGAPVYLGACSAHNSVASEAVHNVPKPITAPQRPPVLEPPLEPTIAQSASLWTDQPKGLFGDRRAAELGDVVTVMIEIDEEAELESSRNSNSSGDNNFRIGALFGLPEALSDALPAGASLDPAIDVMHSQNRRADGTTRRGGKITLRLAAQVVDILPNGYLQIIGFQEIRVNNDMRELRVSGVIRTADITRLNTVSYDKIANARVYYGGQGQGASLRKGWIKQKAKQLIDF